MFNILNGAKIQICFQLYLWSNEIVKEIWIIEVEKYRLNDGKMEKCDDQN